MAIFNARLSKLDKSEVLRYAGQPGPKITFPDLLLSNACTQSLILSKPKGCWQTYKYNPEEGIILAAHPLRLTSCSIRSHLTGATAVAVIAVTIGIALERQVNELFRQGEYAAGLLLDAAGTVTVENAADQLNHLISRQSALQGLSTIRRFSPGYGDWDITVQPEILSLAQQEAVGITTTESCMLLPRKSITAVIGLSPKTDGCRESWKTQTSCTLCNNKNCLARKEFTS